MNRSSVRAGLAAALAGLLLVPVGASAASAAGAAATPAAPAAQGALPTGSADQPLDYGPPGTVPTGRIAPPPSLAQQQAVSSQPLKPTTTPRLVAAVRPYGGDYMRGDNATSSIGCTNGFNVTSAAQIQYMLMAGHCVKDAPFNWYWPSDATSVVGTGNSATLSATGGDHGTLKATADRPNQVRIKSGTVIQTLTAGGNPRVSERACSSNGFTNKDNCGTVTAINQTIQADDGTGNLVTINHLFRMENPLSASCGQPGDSSSPFLEGAEGVGILSAVAMSSDHVWCIEWGQQLGDALTAEKVHLG